MTNEHVDTDSLKIKVNRNRFERALSYKHLGVIVNEKVTWKDNCKRLCCNAHMSVLS